MCEKAWGMGFEDCWCRSVRHTINTHIYTHTHTHTLYVDLYIYHITNTYVYVDNTYTYVYNIYNIYPNQISHIITLAWSRPFRTMLRFAVPSPPACGWMDGSIDGFVIRVGMRL